MFCHAPLRVRFTHASTVTPVVALSDADDGTVTMSSTPSKEAAVFVSAVRAPCCPRTTPFWYVPGFVAVRRPDREAVRAAEADVPGVVVLVGAGGVGPLRELGGRHGPGAARRGRG